MELPLLRLGGTGHPGRLVIHPEVVLDRDRGERLRLAAYLDLLLRLDRLVEPVRPAPPVHLSAGVFVDDQYITVLHHVLHVLLVQGIRLHELVDDVDLLGLLRVFAFEPLDLAALLVGGQRLVVLDMLDVFRDVGDDERLGVVGREHVETLFRDLDRLPLLVHREKEHLVDLGQPLLAHEVGFGPLDELLHAGARLQLQQPLVLRRAALRGEQLQTRVATLLRILLVLRLVEQRRALGHETVDDPRLLAGDRSHLSVVPLVHVAFVAAGGSGDDERGAGLVDEHRVDLVDDRVRVSALHAMPEFDHHVVAQVVEPEFVVRPVGDVGLVGRAPLLASRRRILEHAHREAEIVEDGAHPLRVAPGEIVVDGDEMDAAAREGVEVQRHRGHERLPLAGGHLGNLPFVEDDPADELHIVRDHVPRHLVARDLDLRPEASPARLAHGRERLGQDLIEHGLQRLVELTFRRRDAFGEVGAPRRIFGEATLLPQRLDGLLELDGPLRDDRPELPRLRLEGVFREIREPRTRVP